MPFGDILTFQILAVNARHQTIILYTCFHMSIITFSIMYKHFCSRLKITFVAVINCLHAKILVSIIETGHIHARTVFTTLPRLEVGGVRSQTRWTGLGYQRQFGTQPLRSLDIFVFLVPVSQKYEGSIASNGANINEKVVCTTKKQATEANNLKHNKFARHSGLPLIIISYYLGHKVYLYYIRINEYNLYQRGKYTHCIETYYNCRAIITLQI